MPPKIGEVTHDRSLLGRRDAFHSACILAVSENALFAGDPVHFIDEALTQVEWCSRWSTPHGRVDPFAQTPEGEASFHPGTILWIMLYPGMVQDLHHNFGVKLPGEPEKPLAEIAGLDASDAGVGFPCDECDAEEYEELDNGECKGCET